MSPVSTAFHDTTLAAPGSTDPTRRVNYVNGMILGVDDFIQEATYLLGRDRWLAREAVGYGTLTGLDVTVAKIAPGGGAGEPGRWQVAVSPGVALTPTGHLVEVPRVQCALLDDWLIANRATVTPPAGGAPLSIYVVLRYAECLTDDQPIPGEPCGTRDVYAKPSRITDDFALELALAAPDQVEEDAVRAFAAWLAAIPIGGTHSEAGLAAFAERLRVFTVAQDPVPDGADVAPVEDWGTVPPPADLTLPATHVAEYLRAAFRVWVTEYRPALPGDPRPRGSTGPAEENLLLARLAVTLKEATDTFGNRVHVADPEVEPAVDDTSRPLLAHLRMLEEWLLYQLREGAGPGTPPPEIAYGAAVASETTFGLAASAGSATEVARADHTHGTPPDPIPGHTSDPNAHALGKDVTGPLGQATVVALQGRAVAATAPANGQVLTFRNGSWQPVAVPVPPSQPVTGPFVEHATDRPYRIVAAGTIQFFFGDGTLEIFAASDQLYNELKPLGMDGGERVLTVAFEGYQRPDFGNPADHRYIVKVTPWLEYKDEPTALPFAVAVRRFGDEGIELQVTPLRETDEERGRIMIEISEYVIG
jgi:hypothetical protein